MAIGLYMTMSLNLNTFLPKKGATQVGGFGAIGNLFPSQWNWQGFWSSTPKVRLFPSF